jgi:predicted RNA-binding protein
VTFEIIIALAGVALALAGLAVTVVLAIIGAAIAWGSLRNEVRSNFRSHCELAAELRPKVTQLTEAQSQSKASHDTLEERLRGFKEQLDRIEGSITRRKA